MIRLIHLCDMHFSGGNDFLNSRADQISRLATHQLLDGTSAIAILWNGDFANRGEDDEFRSAAQFVARVLASVKSSSSSSVTVFSLFTPGNHDCDFTTDQTLRDLGLTSLSPTRPSESVENAILAPLLNYFRFTNDLASPTSVAITREAPYVTSLQIPDGAHTLKFLLLNSAWMSRRHERANENTFPLEVLPTITSPPTAVTVVAMHHPLNWFRMPDTKTQLRAWIEDSADLLITGHEHFARESRLDVGQVKITSCEGGALNLNSDATDGSFQVLDIACDTGAVQLRRFEWSCSSGTYEVAHDRALSVKNGASPAKRFRFTKAHTEWIESPMLPIQTHSRQNIKLQDFFQYPDLNEYSNSVAPDEKQMIPAQRVCDTLAASERCLLTGEETSGKTALARQLIIDFHNKGKVPVYISGRDLLRCTTKQHVEQIVSRNIKKQYEDLTYEAIGQLYNSALVLFVDDYHLLYQGGARPTSITEALQDIAPHLVLFASDEMVLCETHSLEGSFGDYAAFRKFQICEFGQLRIEALAKKWIEIGENSKQMTPDKLQREVAKLTKQIQNVLSADVIPHQPWILIVLLHQTDDDTMLVRNGSYGHMYQAIVTAALSRSKTSMLELTGKFAYLGRLAHKILSLGTEYISRREAEAFHDEYRRNVDIPLEFEATLDDFVAAGVLKANHEGIRIVSKYAYCFFLAWNLSRNLYEDWAKNEVRRLSTQLYDPISANTLLFLAHLNNTPFICQTILSSAASIFAEAPMADFAGDVDKLNSLGGTSNVVSIPTTDPEANRTQFIENRETSQPISVSETAKDLQMVAIIDPHDKKLALMRQMHDIQSAYKMIRILGQILKNEADAADSEWKVEIVSEVYRLSRRMLGSAFEELKDVDKWRELAAVRIRDEALRRERRKEAEKGRTRESPYLRSRVSDVKLSIKADREIISICWLACFTVVKVVAEATGAHSLTGTFEKVVAMDRSIPNQLFQLDVLMEHGEDFPLKEALALKEELRNNQFTLVLLKSLIAHHFYLYRVRFDSLQRICNKMEIRLDTRKALSLENKRTRPKGPPRIR